MNVRAPEHVAAECERRFQAGGPRVYVVETDGRIQPTQMSGTRAARGAFADQVVYARRKVNGRYAWVQIAAKA